MMKKWLNIKPKEYDFSADEVDTETETETETESEDDSMVHGLSFALFSIMFLEYPALNQVFCNFCLLGYSLKDARRHMRDDHGLRENQSDFRSQLSGNPFFCFSKFVMSIYLFQIKLFLPI